MAVRQEEYESIRDKVIAKFKILYKDALAMDLCEVPKDIRIRLLEDPIYQAKTKAARANLFAQQLETLDAVLAGSYCNTDKPDLYVKYSQRYQQHYELNHWAKQQREWRNAMSNNVGRK